MELLIVWLGTIVLSAGFELSLGLKMFKDVADQGYKIDVKRYSEVSEQLNPESIKKNTISFFIPIVNIMQEFDKLAKYNAAGPLIVDELRVMDCLIPFTKEEKENYNLKPTGLNAHRLAAKKAEENTSCDTQISFSFLDIQINKSSCDDWYPIDEWEKGYTDPELEWQLESSTNKTIDHLSTKLRAEKKELLRQLRIHVITSNQQSPIFETGHSKIIRRKR